MNGQSPRERAAWCAAMREFVDLVESDSAIPVPDSVDIWTHLWPGEGGMTLAQRTAAVHGFAERFGVPVHAEGGEHRQAKAEIDRITMWVHSYPELSPHAPTDKSKSVVVSRADDAALLDESFADAEHGCTEEQPDEHSAMTVNQVLRPLCPSVITRDGEQYRCLLFRGHDDPDDAELVDAGHRFKRHYHTVGGEWDTPPAPGECLDESMVALGEVDT